MGNYKVSIDSKPTIDYITPISIVKGNYKTISELNLTHTPFHALGFVKKGSAELRRIDCIYTIKNVYNGNNLKVFMQKGNNDEVELYNTEKDNLISTKKHMLPTQNGTVGILSCYTTPYIKNFKVTLNDAVAVAPNNAHRVDYASPAIPAIKNKTYRLADFTFDFSQTVRNVKGDSIKWSSEDNKLVLKDGTFRAVGSGVYTLFGEYMRQKKKFFIVTERDEQGAFVLFSFNFKNWHRKNNSLTLKNFSKEKGYNETSVLVIKDGLFKDFTHFKIKGERFAILLNSDIVKHFSNYTLSTEMFTDNVNYGPDKSFGFISRFNPTDQIPRQCKHLACTITLDNGVKISSENKKFTDGTTRTCADKSLSLIKTLQKNDMRANFKIPLNSDWCFYIPKGGDYVFNATNDQELEYILLTFDTNIEIPDFAYKLFFHFKNDKLLFQNLLIEKNPFGKVSKCFELFKILSETTKNSPFAGESLSKKIKFLIEDTSWQTLNKLSVENIAEQMAVSHSHLCALFKKETGVTVQEYIIDTKLNISKDILKTYGKSFEEVAGLLGYSNYKTFAHAFKNKFGITPKQFMENM